LCLRSPDTEEKIMFKKILVPLDGSDLAAQILPQVETLARQVHAQVTLLAVGSSDTCAGGGATPEPIQAGAACPELPLAAYLEQTAGKLRAQGVEVNWAYKQGQPAHQIVTYADANGMDLIAIASHGAGAIAWVLGSVAKRVIAHAPVAVLLLRVVETKPPGLKSEFFYSMQTP
jgi:nucleotide-binding universal stress UspA family protein